MPKPNLMALRWVLASAAALVAVAAWCPPAGAVVGGQDVNSIGDAPYQVALIRNDRDALWCGGSIRDEQHIITAAHCVFDNSLGSAGQPVRPESIDVFAGSKDIGATSNYWQVPVKSISFDEDYDPATFDHDAAILTLNGNLSRVTHQVESIDLYSDNGLPLPSTATITGWGQRGNGTYPRILQIATNVPIFDKQRCVDAYPGFDVSSMICAGGDNAPSDACFGDSGGPLVVPDDIGAPRLLGIVSFGPASGCRIRGFPGGYTAADDDEIASYLGPTTNPNPTPAPRTLSAPSVQGDVAVGSTVSCNPGSWDGSPSFTYQFVVPTAGGDVARTTRVSQSTYTVQPADAGQTLRCDVKGTNAGGLAFAKSAAVAVPVPQTPSPPQTPPPSSNPPTTTPSQQDSAAPVARVVKTTCTSTRCTLTVAVSDAGFSAGIQTVKATVRSTYRTTCTRKGKKVACTKTKNGKPKVSALGGTRFKIVASKLPIGRQRFTLIAVDKAGHRQALPTTKTVTTKKPKKKRR
jgi:hypothetical protein